ncbi:unnamed protein product [Rangifer tarandus platyrhynchus]|uniref:Uncharacterized protein n=1 Tax=Rangifer tarandus platyrhynchus TaxID=3082113 RepID=A0ABN8YYR3_RANTA|nr:unnamed protein product [Rangifer tarandus platyrhynchus]
MTPAHPHTTNLAVGAQAHCPTPFPISASLGGRAGSHWGLQHGGKHPVTVVPPAFAMKLGRLAQATGSGRPSLRAAGQPEPPLRATVTTLTGHSTRDSGLRPTAAEGTIRGAREPRLTRAGRASEAGRTAEPRATGGSAEGGQAKTARAAGGSRVGCREAAELRAPSRTREAALIHLQQATMLCPHSDSHAGAQSHGHGPGHSGSRRTQQPCSALTCHVVPTHRLPTAFARAGTLDSHVPWDFGVRAHLGAPGQLRGPHRRSLHRHGVHPEELL